MQNLPIKNLLHYTDGNEDYSTLWQFIKTNRKKKQSKSNEV